MILPVGTRVMHLSGRAGTISYSYPKTARAGSRYYRVTFDEKVNSFEPDEVRVYGRDITPLDPKLHEKWEDGWKAAPFVDRSWAVIDTKENA